MTVEQRDIINEAAVNDDNTYRIIGTYKGQEEEIDSDIDSREYADYLISEYSLAFGKDWTLRIEIEE